MLGEHYLHVCIVLGSSVEKGYKVWVFFPGVCLGLLISVMGSLNTSAYHFGQISPSNFVRTVLWFWVWENLTGLHKAMFTFGLK